MFPLYHPARQLTFGHDGMEPHCKSTFPGLLTAQLSFVAASKVHSVQSGQLQSTNSATQQL